MVIVYIKDYTRSSGKVILSGSLSEVDNETAAALIIDGYAHEFAVNTSDVGCQAMLAKNHLLGMNENITIYEPDPEQDED